VNVIEIRVPALRERLDDIDELVDSIITRLGRQIGNRSLRITEAASRALREYHFPGNVRELENVLERAVTLSGSGMVEAEHIRLRAVPRVGSASSAAPAAPQPEGAGALTDQLEHLERDAIIKALEQTRYNKTAAAKLLGVTYRALRYKIQKLEIE
jgi:two-component system response regulator PilR (NtrC family)